MDHVKPSTTATLEAPVCFELPAILDMRHARALKQALCERSARAIEIDGSKVERLSTGCIQLLVAFVQTRSRDGSQVTFGRSSLAMRQAFLDLGLNTDGNAKEPGLCASSS